MEVRLQGNRFHTKPKLCKNCSCENYCTVCSAAIFMRACRDRSYARPLPTTPNGTTANPCWRSSRKARVLISSCVKLGLRQRKLGISLHSGFVRRHARSRSGVHGHVYHSGFTLVSRVHSVSGRVKLPSNSNLLNVKDAHNSALTVQHSLVGRERSTSLFRPHCKESCKTAQYWRHAEYRGVRLAFDVRLPFDVIWKGQLCQPIEDRKSRHLRDYHT